MSEPFLHFPAGRQPSCPYCKSRLRQTRIEPRPRGYELQLFECTNCDRPHELTVESDPLKAAAGWINSSLKPPE